MKVLVLLPLCFVTTLGFKIIFPAQTNLGIYERWLKNCTENEEMPYFNKTSKSFECYPILEQGPCEPKYWFVLDPKTPDEAICVEEACACEHTDYVYDYGDDFGSETDLEDSCFLQYDAYDHQVVYNSVMFNGKCTAIEDYEQCPRGQEIFPNPFGIGECGCKKGFLQYFDENESLSCYQEYLQGPCAEGQQYVLSDEGNDFKPICKPTNCDAPNKTRFKDTCLTVPTCENEEMVEFNVENNESLCKLGLYVRSSLIGGRSSCQKGERKDARGECKKTIGGRKGKGKRSPTTYGGGRRLRDVCCS